MGMIARVVWGKRFEHPCFLHTQGCANGAGYRLEKSGLPYLYACHMHLGEAVEAQQQLLACHPRSL